MPYPLNENPRPPDHPRHDSLDEPSTDDPSPDDLALDDPLVTHPAFHAHRVLDNLLTTDPYLRLREITVEKDFAAAHHLLRGDAGSLKRLLALVLRAITAHMADGARLSIRSHNANAHLCITFSHTQTAPDGPPPSLPGLVVARHIIEHHGGGITIASHGPSREVRLRLDLPLRAPAGAAEDGPMTGLQAGAPEIRDAEPAAATRPLRVLLVEDHAATRTTLARLLARRRHEVSAAPGVETGLALAADRTFDLVISDIGLPDGDGCALMEKLRAIQPTLLGIALSGFGSWRDVARSRAAGFARHLVKPVDIHILDNVVAELFP